MVCDCDTYYYWYILPSVRISTELRRYDAGLSTTYCNTYAMHIIHLLSDVANEKKKGSNHIIHTHTYYTRYDTLSCFGLICIRIAE